MTKEQLFDAMNLADMYAEAHTYLHRLLHSTSDDVELENLARRNMDAARAKLKKFLDNV